MKLGRLGQHWFEKTPAENFVRRWSVSITTRRPGWRSPVGTTRWYLRQQRRVFRNPKYHAVWMYVYAAKIYMIGGGGECNWMKWMVLKKHTKNFMTRHVHRDEFFNVQKLGGYSSKYLVVFLWNLGKKHCRILAPGAGGKNYGSQKSEKKDDTKKHHRIKRREKYW